MTSSMEGLKFGLAIVAVFELVVIIGLWLRLKRATKWINERKTSDRQKEIARVRRLRLDTQQKWSDWFTNTIEGVIKAHSLTGEYELTGTEGHWSNDDDGT